MICNVYKLIYLGALFKIALLSIKVAHFFRFVDVCVWLKSMYTFNTPFPSSPIWANDARAILELSSPTIDQKVSDIISAISVIDEEVPKLESIGDADDLEKKYM